MKIELVGLDMNVMRSSFVVLGLVLLMIDVVPAEDSELGASSNANQKAIGQVRTGERHDANAAWWGFNPMDSTDAIQAAIDSGAKRVTIPYRGQPWIVRPIKLTSDQEVYLEPGVVVLAKEGEFHGKGDKLFKAAKVKNLVFRGYGATLRMRKADYMNAPYVKAEWRMGLALVDCTNVLVEGVRIERTGGDGIYVDGESKDVVIRNVICYDNYRQGISIISVDNLLIENSVFANTWGTAPGSGIDIEPDKPDQRLVNIVVRNCVFENNEGHEVSIYPKSLTDQSEDISIRFENCLMRKTLTNGVPDGVAQGIGRDDQIHGGAGISVSALRDKGPGGTIEFINCTVENTGRHNLLMYDKSALNIKVRFKNCHFRNPWLGVHRKFWMARVPIYIDLARPELTEHPGGIDFDDCHVYDALQRPVLMRSRSFEKYGVSDIHGILKVHGPGEPRYSVGLNARNIDLRLVKGFEAEGVEERNAAFME